MSSNGSNCVVVVWEVESILLNKYVPYSSSVSQHLERAYAKKLTQVFLGDSDANLIEYYVNLRTMKQCSEKPDAEHPLVNVRRQFYNPLSPAGKGIRWEYAGNTNSEWHQYDMEIQCLIEDAWSNGSQQIDISSSYIHMPYIIDFSNMTQTRKPSGPIRQIRRVSQAPYPLTKLPSAINSTQSSMVLNTKQIGNFVHPASSANSLSTSRMSINSVNRRSVKSNYLHHQQALSTSSPRLTNYGDTISQTGSTRSAPSHVTSGIPPSGKSTTKPSTKPPKPTKTNSSESTTSPTNLARQILNNLNIFSHHHHNHHHDKGESSSNNNNNHKKGFLLSHVNSNKSSKKSLCKNLHGSTSTLDMETVSINSRRPSVDTISTYLSNGSKNSRGGSVRGKTSYGSVSDLLNCSLSSENDDVFLSSHSSLSSSMSMNMIIKGSIVGVDSSSEQISKFVSVVNDIIPSAQPCPICLNELHRDNNAKNPTVSLSRCQHLMHLNCLNELILSQKSDLQKNLYIECPTCGIIYGDKRGNQPPGTMSWITIPKSLPGHEDCNTIQIIYNIASGIQTQNHPNPGRAFFAVGFPRICYLPENQTGRKILKFLKISFDRGLLFSIGRSATTGKEDVVVWKNVEHKTQFSMYPDPTYLQRVMEQLVHLGVTD